MRFAFFMAAANFLPLRFRIAIDAGPILLFRQFVTGEVLFDQFNHADRGFFVQDSIEQFNEVRLDSFVVAR